MLALYERATGLSLDLKDGQWKPLTSNWPPDCNTDFATSGSDEADLRRQIDECERKLADLRGPSVPPLSMGALNQISETPLPWVWQRDSFLALLKYLKSEPAQLLHAGWSLAEEQWRVLYKSQRNTAGPFQARAQSQPRSGTPAASARPSGCPPGACFRCGMHGHWARDCTEPVPGASHPLGDTQGPADTASQTSTQPARSSHMPEPHFGRRGGFTQVGSQTLYTAFSTGRTYDASGPPPYPCIKCGQMHWSWQGCPTHAAPRPDPPSPPQAPPPDAGGAQGHQCR
jgi:hypothetical protein